MATGQIARYATPGGGVVAVEERTLLGLFDLTFVAECSGCQAGTTETTEYTPWEMAKNSALLWAERHSAGCRRVPAAAGDQ